MKRAHITYHHGQEELQGFLVCEEEKGPRPAVIIAHDWSGRNDFACEKAQLLAQLGYVGFALDMYGHARVFATIEEKSAAIEPFLKDQRLLRGRVQAALEMVRKLPEVDAQRIAIVGFCFGGMCALELARAGADILGAVSFHGLLHRPGDLETGPIKAKILALHGYEDPLANPEIMQQFCKEMTTANADWQVHVYGRVQHAFTNPQAHNTEMGLIFNETAAKRSWTAMSDFLKEIFN